jgi:hypothetical protein
MMEEEEGALQKEALVRVHHSRQVGYTDHTDHFVQPL